MSEWVSETSACTYTGPSGSGMAGHEIESEAVESVEFLTSAQ